MRWNKKKLSYISRSGANFLPEVPSGAVSAFFATVI
jgi:hypothetical protein